jgi:N-acetylglutamate synthase-like GNAT family acetyltransferase
MGKDDFRIHDLAASRHGEALALLRAGGAYWIEHASDYTVLVSMRPPSVMIGAVDANDRLVGCARILSDNARVAWIFDVMVDRALRGSGLGMQIMEHVLAHPTVRGIEKVRLGTRDAVEFYRKLGFIPVDELVRPYPSIDMIRVTPR